jgi:hypothetical protein
VTGSSPTGRASPGLSEAVFHTVPRPGGAHAVSKFLPRDDERPRCGARHMSPTRVKPWTARRGAPIRLGLQIFAERKLLSIRSRMRVCRRVGSLRAEARRPRYLRRNQPCAPYLLEWPPRRPGRISAVRYRGENVILPLSIHPPRHEVPPMLGRRGLALRSIIAKVDATLFPALRHRVLARPECPERCWNGDAL